MKVLGIETSCDDTSLCIIDYTPDEQVNILSHISFSGEILLRKWGGIVPEIAARNHLAKLAPLMKEAFEQASVSPKEIELIGVTTYPGLLGPLLTGLNAAKTISLLHKTPIVGVNHLFAHLEAIHLTEKINYPYLGLIVSGGHTLFLKVNSPTEIKVISSTVDDAAGEAFDKGGKLMGLGYPAGALIDQLARKGNPKKYSFPIGLDDARNPNLSFSGLKTSLRVFLENNPSIKSDSPEIADLCASYQEAIVSALKKKAKVAMNLVKDDLPLVVGGGVACNSRLRMIFQQNFSQVHFVAPKFCTDNGAMIAHYGLLIKDQAISFPECLNLDAKSRFIDKKDFISR